METLTLEQSVLRGTVLGKPIMCTVSTSPPGLKLPPGSYLLRPPQNNPVYGPVMAIENVAGDTGDEALKTPAAYTPSGALVKVPPASRAKRAPPAVKADAPSIKFDAPAIKFDAPAIKFDAAAAKIDVAAIKFDSPAAKFDAPASGWDVFPGRQRPWVPISDRMTGGNCVIVTAGYGDLVEVVQRAGAVRLVVR
jgi:hypothetical protein